MLGPRHLPTAIQLHSFETDLQKHYNKLEKIHKNESRKKAIDNEGQDMSKLFETRAKGLKFHINEKNQQIEKDNELLLGKLVEISRKKKPGLTNIKTEGALPKTLHGPSRKKEKDRIAAENEAFARRLLSQQPSFDRKRLELDYEKHNSRVKNMQKLIGFSPRKLKLPPLHKDDFDTRKSSSVEKKDAKHNEKKNHAKKPEKIAEDENEYTADEDEKTENAAQKNQQSQKSIVVDTHHGTSKQDVGRHSPSKAGTKVTTEQKVHSTANASQKNVGSHKDVQKSSRDVSPSKKEVEQSSVKDLAPASQKEEVEAEPSHREAPHESLKEVGEDKGLKAEKAEEEPKHDENNIEEDIDAHKGMSVAGGSKKL